ncbi:hypothetical protein ACA910_013385 [Epithemia clementina (nom. ined.)]
MSAERLKIANDIASQWGPAVTKAMLEGDVSSFKDLFAEPVAVVLQNALGEEVEFSIADQVEGATMSWKDFVDISSKDVQEQSYVKTEAQCLGVLSDRFILATGRFNTEGEVYMEAYTLITVNAAGKIVAVEAFTDSNVSHLTDAAAASE